MENVNVTMLKRIDLKIVDIYTCHLDVRLMPNYQTISSKKTKISSSEEDQEEDTNSDLYKQYSIDLILM
jgi:hypothetical protein